MRERSPRIGSPVRWRRPTAPKATSIHFPIALPKFVPGHLYPTALNGCTIRSTGRIAPESIEDKLSDALHERLTQRFVDRRTSVLMRRLRDKEEMMAEIADDGQILVENHFVGRLDGFRFTPDSTGDGIHGKAARNAATQVLARELASRADALAAAADEAITLSSNGRILWQGSRDRPARSRRDGAEAPYRGVRRRKSERRPTGNVSPPASMRGSPPISTRS